MQLAASLSQDIKSFSSISSLLLFGAMTYGLVLACARCRSSLVMSRATCVVSGSRVPPGPGAASRPRIAIFGLPAHADPPKQISKTRHADERALRMWSYLPVEAQRRTATVGRDDRRDRELAPLPVRAACGLCLGVAAVADERHVERTDRGGADHP